MFVSLCQISYLHRATEYRQTESGAYEPTMHLHRCSQKTLCFWIISEMYIGKT